MVGNAVEVTDDSIAVNRDVIARLVKIITNLQFQMSLIEPALLPDLARVSPPWPLARVDNGEKKINR